MRKKKNNCFDYCIEIECNNLKITEVYNTRIFALQKLAPFKKFTWHICMSKHIILYFGDVMAQNNWRTFQRGDSIFTKYKYVISLFCHCTK